MVSAGWVLEMVGEKQNVVTRVVLKQTEFRDYRLVLDILVEVPEFAAESLRHTSPTVYQLSAREAN